MTETGYGWRSSERRRQWLLRNARFVSWQIGNGMAPESTPPVSGSPHWDLYPILDYGIEKIFAAVGLSIPSASIADESLVRHAQRNTEAALPASVARAPHRPTASRRERGGRGERRPPPRGGCAGAREEGASPRRVRPATP